jgi:hypothetical protein
MDTTGYTFFIACYEDAGGFAKVAATIIGKQAVAST